MTAIGAIEEKKRLNTPRSCGDRDRAPATSLISQSGPVVCSRVSASRVRAHTRNGDGQAEVDDEEQDRNPPLQAEEDENAISARRLQAFRIPQCGI